MPTEKEVQAAAVLEDRLLEIAASKQRDALFQQVVNGAPAYPALAEAGARYIRDRLGEPGFASPPEAQGTK